MIRVNPHQWKRPISGVLIKSDVTLETLFFTSQPER